MPDRLVEFAVTQVKPGYPLRQEVPELLHYHVRRPEAYPAPFSQGVGAEDTLLGTTALSLYTHHRPQLLVSLVVKETAAGQRQTPEVSIRPGITGNGLPVAIDQVGQMGNISAFCQRFKQSRHRLLTITSNAGISPSNSKNNIGHNGETNAPEENKRRAQFSNPGDQLANPGQERPPSGETTIIGIADGQAHYQRLVFAQFPGQSGLPVGLKSKVQNPHRDTGSHDGLTDVFQTYGTYGRLNDIGINKQQRPVC